MKNTVILLLASLFTFVLAAQDNCNVFLMNGDSCRFEACTFLEQSPGYFQLTKEYHEIKDQALEICPEYSIVYKQKSTAYLKTGDFVNWKILIDKAVALNPRKNLDYRAWCRFQFFRDYKGAIEDIEELERIVGGDIGYCQNGDYHLLIAKGLCYKMLGQADKAREIIKDQMEKDPTAAGLYDYLHLGVLYLEDQEYEKALASFENQLKINDLAEVYYYKALAYKKMGLRQEYGLSISKSEEYYRSSRYMLDIYTHHVDKIYLEDILRELEKG